MNRRTAINVAVFACLALAAAIVVPRFGHLILTGQLFPADIVEELENPVAVLSWSERGLHVADGRVVSLPGFESLPTESEALAEATREGVSVDTSGNVFGLVRVHHWCGNDPVRKHVARVNLASLLQFLSESYGDSPSGSIPPTEESRFSRAGWNVSEYYQFERWAQSR
ncbi:MAG TPA: hypothetical protein VML55_19695 [Planctomycetaceae bacterium]|nr:hypothetical protein [Planctomycetaceae bacterium]